MYFQTGTLKWKLVYLSLGHNGNDGNTNSLDIKSSPPGTPQSNPSSTSTGGGGQSTGCGQSGGNTGGVCGGNKMMAIRVQMLDDSITLFQVQVNWRLILRKWT